MIRWLVQGLRIWHRLEDKGLHIRVQRCFTHQTAQGVQGDIAVTLRLRHGGICLGQQAIGLMLVSPRKVAGLEAPCHIIGQLASICLAFIGQGKFGLTAVVVPPPFPHKLGHAQFGCQKAAVQRLCRRLSELAGAASLTRQPQWDGEAHFILAAAIVGAHPVGFAEEFQGWGLDGPARSRRASGTHSLLADILRTGFRLPAPGKLKSFSESQLPRLGLGCRRGHLLVSCRRLSPDRRGAHQPSSGDDGQ